jgi:PncC family amidohydrolase
MKKIIRQIQEVLIQTGQTVAVAESCTGGLLSKYLTDYPGSSRYFILGLVTYSNKAKEKILKIPHTLILKKGAVSKEVAQLMAKSVRKITNSTIGIAITGIAGPDGATLNKPVGTVFIAIDKKNRSVSKRFHFKGRRNKVRIQSALKSLELLKKIA